jgi:hypothetical protein
VSDLNWGGKIYFFGQVPVTKRLRAVSSTEKSSLNFNIFHGIGKTLGGSLPESLAYCSTSSA